MKEVSKFQFLNGTIKSNILSFQNGFIGLFQFLNGTIKSDNNLFRRNFYNISIPQRYD